MTGNVQGRYDENAGCVREFSMTGNVQGRYDEKCIKPLYKPQQLREFTKRL